MYQALIQDNTPKYSTNNIAKALGSSKKTLYKIRAKEGIEIGKPHKGVLDVQLGGFVAAREITGGLSTNLTSILWDSGLVVCTLGVKKKTGESDIFVLNSFTRFSSQVSRVTFISLSRSLMVHTRMFSANGSP